MQLTNVTVAGFVSGASTSRPSSRYESTAQQPHTDSYLPHTGKQIKIFEA